MQLSTQKKKRLEQIAEQLNLKLIIAYGSKAQGNARVDSDLDIAVLTKTIPDYGSFKAIYGELSSILSGENIDLRFLNDADPLFAMQVVKHGILLYGDENDFNDLKILVNRRYIDDGMKYFPFREQLLKEQQKRLKKFI